MSDLSSGETTAPTDYSKNDVIMSIRLYSCTDIVDVDA